MYVMLTLSDLMCAASSGILLRSSRASMTASLLYSFPTPHATTGCLSRCELMAQCRHRAIRATSLPALGRGGEGGRGRHMKHGKEHSSPGIHKAAYHVHTYTALMGLRGRSQDQLFQVCVDDIAILRTHTYTYTHIHTYVHTYVRTHITMHTYVHTSPCIRTLGPRYLHFICDSTKLLCSFQNCQGRSSSIYHEAKYEYRRGSATLDYGDSPYVRELRKAPIERSGKSA